MSPTMAERTPQQQNRPRRARWAAAVAAFAILVLLAGYVTAGSASVGDEQPISEPESSLSPETSARPPAAIQTPAPAEPPSAPEDPAPEAQAPVLESAQPLSISIPALGVDATVMDLGLNEDGTMQVPPHAPRAESQAGWYRHSPTPGALGPSVIVGHVDSDRHGPSVFYGLDTLTEGDTVEVVRDDGVTAVFAVEHVAQYFKEEFPNQEVYGNLDHAGLRLITCGGNFDTDTLAYDDNIVVYANLVTSYSHPPLP